MNVDRDELQRAAAQGLLTPEQADALWDALQAGAVGPSHPAPPLDPLRAAGAVSLGLFTAGAVAWLLVLAAERFPGTGALALAVALGVAFVLAARWRVRCSDDDAASILAAGAVAMAPAGMHGVQHVLGLAHSGAAPFDTLAGWSGSPWFLPAAAAVAAATLAVAHFRLPFLGAVLVATLWFVAMDAAPIVFGPHPSWDQRALLSSLLGLVALAVGLLLDGRTRRDHAGWLYLAGLVAFWGGLTTYHARTGPSVALGALVNAGLVLAAVAIGRRSFAVLGILGLAGVVGEVASRTLVDEVAPFAFAAIALGVAGAAVAYHRFEASWRRELVERLPGWIRAFLPRAARARR